MYCVNKAIGKQHGILVMSQFKEIYSDFSSHLKGT